MTRYICLFLIVLLGSCGGEKKKDTVIRVSVLRGPSAIAFASWMDNPPTVNGKTIEVTIIDSPELMQAILIKGEADIAVLPMINAANLYNKGVVYPLLGCPIWGTLYLVGRDSATHTGKPIHIFGAGTNPDILTRHYIREQHLNYTPNYSFGTAHEIMQGLLIGKVETAVLGEPFLSIALRKDSTLHILADLNNPGSASPGFAQTAVVYNPSLKKIKNQLDSLLALSCHEAAKNPAKAIRMLEAKGIFAPGMLTPESVGRCRIHYLSAEEAKESVTTFLQLINEYEPKAIGGKLPEAGFIGEKQ